MRNLQVKIHFATFVRLTLILSSGFLFSNSSNSELFAQEKYELKPIRYSQRTPTDKVQQLADLLATGEVQLDWNKKNGFLESLLEQLKIPTSSQSLVFTKTSLQVAHISPRTPRAVYFNDDIYVGWVQNGDVIEISAADPKLGATFYSLKQLNSKPPALRRETSRCLQCHDSSRTGGRPGHMVRSVFPIQNGQPEYGLGTLISTHQSPFSERFGGWFVSGTHGQMRHRGNSWLAEKSGNTSTRRHSRNPEELDTETHANKTDLSDIVDVSPYLTSHSDLVAQLVLQHQVYMHNLITEANYKGQQAIHDSKTMNKIFERPEDFLSESTLRRFDSAAEKVVEGLLFCGEAELTSPVKGSNAFQTEFEARGPFDEKKRTLRTFDLQKRLFRFPCSFLIYSDAFAQLPEPVLERVYKRLDEVLSGEDQSEEFAHLEESVRQEIREILVQTNQPLGR